MEDFLSAAEERDLVEVFTSLPFEAFDYKGFIARRRVLAYGWTYDFTMKNLSPTRDIPGFLLPVRERAARVAGIAPEELEEALVTEYAAGSPINWHRDLPVFEKVVGISLLSSCTFKLKPYGIGGEGFSLLLQPRSLYIMQGAARWRYQHSIPPVKALRYSITFRTMRK